MQILTTVQITVRLIYQHTNPRHLNAQFWDYKATDINEINESLNSAPWDTAYALDDHIDEILSYNNSLIESTCQEHILHKTVTIWTNDKPWMSNEVRYFFRRRDSFFLKFKRTQSATDQLNFNIARREANTAKRNAIKRCEQKLVNKLSQDHLDVKTFWKLSKNILGCKSDRSIPSLYENGQLIPYDFSKATIFYNYFASISSLTENVKKPDLPNINVSQIRA